MNAAFVVEGDKMVLELLQSNIKIQAIYALESWIEKHHSELQSVSSIVFVVPPKALKSISNLDTPNQVVALAAIPSFEGHLSAPDQFSLSDNVQNPDLEEGKHKTSSYSFVLDNVQNPGNLGTIIRTADWLGMTHLFCSPTCADAFNPKVVQASMGSLFRLHIVYTDLPTLFKRFEGLPVYGALLNGKNLFSTRFEEKGFILMGNEGQGISDDLQSHITHPITIPKRGKAESLNVAIAASIIGSVVVLG